MHYTDLIVMLHLKLLRLDLLLHFRQGRLANYAKHVALVVFVGGLCFYGLDAVEFGDVTACCFRSAPLVLLLATQTMHISEQARREREVLEQRQRHGSRDKEKDEFEGKGKGDGGAADTGDSGMKPHPHVMGAWLRLVCTWLGSYAYFLDAQPRQVFPCPNVLGYGVGSALSIMFHAAMAASQNSEPWRSTCAVPCAAHAGPKKTD